MNAFFEAGYDYDDAVKLAKMWKLADPYQAKVAGGKLHRWPATPCRSSRDRPAAPAYGVRDRADGPAGPQPAAASRGTWPTAAAAGSARCGTTTANRPWSRAWAGSCT